MKRVKNQLKVVPEKFADAHIKRAERTARKIKRHPMHRARHAFVFWSSVIVIVCANLLVSLILVPFLTLFNSVFFDAITLLIALIIGVMYAFLLLDVAHLQRGHRLFAGFFVPFISVTNALILWTVVVGYIEKSGGVITRDPWMISALYGLVFAMPYVMDLLRTKK